MSQEIWLASDSPGLLLIWPVKGFSYFFSSEAFSSNEIPNEIPINEADKTGCAVTAHSHTLPQLPHL